MTGSGVAALPQATVPAEESAEARDLGIQLTQEGRFREGYTYLLPWVQSHPEDLEARFHASWSAAFLGRTYEAADLLAELDEADPRVQFLWGKLLLDKRDPRGAIEVLEPLIQTAPPELALQTRRLLAKAWMAEGQADRAVSLLEGRVGEEPALVLELALAQYEAGDARGAAMTLEPYATEALGRFQSEGSDSADALTVALVFEYGRFLLAAANHGQALPFLEAAVELAPDCKQCWQHLAQTYTADDRRQDARVAQERFEDIVKREGPAAETQRQQALDQQDPTSRVLREALENFRAGRSDEALGMLRQESRLRPNDPRTMYLAVRILAETGRLPQALALASSAVEVAPANPDGYFVRGNVFRSMQRWTEAREDFSKALELAPDHRMAAEALAGLPQQ